MCLNCGCGKPDDAHGNPANITADDLRRAGKANGQSMTTSARNIMDGVEQLESDAVGTMRTGAAYDADGGRPAERGTPATES